MTTATKTSSEVWNDAEREAWTERELLKPSDWAGRYRELTRGGGAAWPGPWRNENAPYLRGIMDLVVAPGVVQVNIEKASQIGVSEAARNVLAAMADQEPDPWGLTLPDREKGRQIVADKLIPIFESTRVLQSVLSDKKHDVKKSQIRLANGFVLHLMWSGSSAAMASDPMRGVINDEVDKHAPIAGGETGSIELTWRRLETYEDRKRQVNISTPTLRYGRIHQLLEASDYRLFYHVPCPRCGGYQRLLFPRLKYEKLPGDDKYARARAIVRSPSSVWYECVYCAERLVESQKAAMVLAGAYGTDDAVDGSGRPLETDLAAGRVWDAEAVAQWPRETRLGIQVSALYCLWRNWTDIAAEWIRAAGDLKASFDFRTNTLGEPYERQIARTLATVFQRKSEGARLPEGIVPSWAICLVATIDTQQDHFWIVIRAWGAEMRSQRIYHGRVETFGELDELCLHPWPNEDDELPARRSGMVLIDSGGGPAEDDSPTRTMEVYRWVARRMTPWRRDPGVILRAIKGAASSPGGRYHWIGQSVIPHPSGDKRRRMTGRLWRVATQAYHDRLADMIDAGPSAEDPSATEIWLLNKRDDGEYNEHLSNLHKAVVYRGGRVSEAWQPITSGARHDLRDCEAYQIAAYDMLDAGRKWPTPAEYEQQQAAYKAETKRAATDRGDDEGSEAWTPTRIDPMTL